jgi:hypothetical protein
VAIALDTPCTAPQNVRFWHLTQEVPRLAEELLAAAAHRVCGLGSALDWAAGRATAL